MKTLYKIKQLLSLDTKIIIQKIIGILVKPIYTKIHNENKFIKPYLEKKLNYSINYDAINVPENVFVISKYEENEITNIIDHEFDLLGSNLTQVNYSNIYAGFEGYNYDFHLDYKNDDELVETLVIDEHKNRSKQILNYLSKDYNLIDWCVDFKSGYRWDSQINYKKIKIGENRGADIKVPWELSRLQHLHILADYFIKNLDKVEILEEIQNQLLDFIAFNPPFYGPNWKSPMEVSIRSFNIILLIVLLRKNKINFERQIQSIIDDYLFVSLEFLGINNEWNFGLRNNHYFVNLLGLLSLKMIFKQNFSDIISKIKREILVQFNKDGSNFEGSIPYHFFTFEALQWILLISSKLYSYLVDNKDIYNRLNNISKFSNIILFNYPNYNILGDNDSGVITKYQENILNINKNKSLKDYDDNSLLNFSDKIYNLIKYNNIGLILINFDTYNFAISLGRKCQFGKGGHNHNDKFSFFMNFKQIPIFVDPGTYTYTAIPEIRNIYRSAKMHNTIYYEGIDPFSIDKSSLFWLKDYFVDYKIYTFPYNISINLIDNKRKQTRLFEISNTTILITDQIFAKRENAELNFYLHPSFEIVKKEDNIVEIYKDKIKIHLISEENIKLIDYYYSAAYGSKEIAKSINIKFPKNINKIETKIVFLNS